ncbi:hypothetical protein F0H41_19505 [Vibrio cholerae]|uniref:hypothetical protein n=1 Tax=Vibrio cholerae TaxID=666 RepID=UPI0011F2ECA9|nr:hypothetical protein [Vibrio cholerae]EGR0775382.1 hypothetical protein [Vibrio cholerae]EGR0779358.1 hypothetical protein [Vibrio cholerae]EGR0783187.1 hypothetical protein [Vibrio cholerae]EGR0795234.1 hypothetical protein [Vibrio cholerae]EGR0808789.1 hypothetical protein [Vibrio cholerae]
MNKVTISGLDISPEKNYDPLVPKFDIGGLCNGVLNASITYCGGELYAASHKLGISITVLSKAFSEANNADYILDINNANQVVVKKKEKAAILDVTDKVPEIKPDS